MTELAFYPEIEQHEEGMLDVGDGQSIHWAVCGNPEGKPAVVLHGRGRPENCSSPDTCYAQRRVCDSVRAEGCGGSPPFWMLSGAN